MLEAQVSLNDFCRSLSFRCNYNSLKVYLTFVLVSLVSTLATSKVSTFFCVYRIRTFTIP